MLLYSFLSNPSFLIAQPATCSPSSTLFLILHCFLILHRSSLSSSLQMFPVMYTVKTTDSPALAGSLQVVVPHRKSNKSSLSLSL